MRLSIYSLYLFIMGPKLLAFGMRFSVSFCPLKRNFTVDYFMPHSDVSNRENKSPNERSQDGVLRKADQDPTTDGASSNNPNGNGSSGASVDNQEGFNPDVVTHLLCHTQKSDIYKRAIESRKVRCVTAYWLNDVLTHKKMSQVLTIYYLKAVESGVCHPGDCR